MRAAVQRVEQLRTAEGAAGDRVEQMLLQRGDVVADRGGGQPFSCQHRRTALKRYNAEGSKVAPMKRIASWV